MTNISEAAITAYADQMLAAVKEARRAAPHNRWLADPQAGDGYVVRAARAAAAGREFPFADGEQYPVLVRGDFPEEYVSGLDWAMPLDLDGVATFVGEQECRRCWRPDAVSAVATHVLWLACGRTVVEFAFCDACATFLAERYDLVWERGGPGATV